ncbi:MAG: ATP-grasp domain-containing protein [Methanobrevibacter sp.]|jgi:carbamoyl-phosphate synthase large subunit|nr:ATP-grasp domain-containing protein [Candidatus Methanoflexus mossambicus]
MRVGINSIRFNNPTALIKVLKKIKNFNVEIIGTDVQELGYSAASLLSTSYFQAPSLTEEQEYFNFLTHLCVEKSIDILIPGSDSDVYFLGKYKDKIPSIIITPEINIIEKLNDKLNASLEMSELGVKTPKILNNLVGEKKIIFRKRISSSSTGIYVVDLTSESYIKNYFNSDYFIQRLVKGDEYTVDVFADKNGNPKLIIPRKRLEVKAGMSICSQLIKHQSIINACKMIYSKYYIPGLSNVQFIDDGENIYFIEINLRFAGSGISSILGSFNYLEEYLNHYVNNISLKTLDYYMNLVAWNSIITRYYTEVIYKS